RRAGSAPRREPRVRDTRPLRVERVLDGRRQRRAVEREDAGIDDDAVARRERERVALAEPAFERALLEPAPAAGGLRSDLDRGLVRGASPPAERHDRAV